MAKEKLEASILENSEKSSDLHEDASIENQMQVQI